MSPKLSLDAQIGSWFAKNRKFDEALKDEHGPTICLSREFGCRGSTLAGDLCERLTEQTKKEWHVFDKDLIHQISEEKGISEKFLANLGDYSRIVDRYLTFLKHRVSHDEAFKYLTQYIMNIAVPGYAIIVGRGASILTKDLVNSYRFRLEAPFEFRVQNIQETQSLSKDKAEDYVRENQVIREKFVESYLDTSLSNSASYHAIFNEQACPQGTIADMIIDVVKAGEERRLK